MLTIIDYQMGNLRSVQKAIERVGGAAEISSEPAVIAAAEKVILPGVGAFRDAIAELQERELVEPIKAAIAGGKPFLGICLGLQLLFDRSYEDGEHEGLGVIPGEVVRFDIPPPENGTLYKVPHMGWNRARFTRPDAPLLTGIDPGSHFYFVHSYYVRPRDESVVAITADYPEPFCAAIWRDNLFATQFHPEKSQAAGLKLLENFVGL